MKFIRPPAGSTSMSVLDIPAMCVAIVLIVEFLGGVSLIGACGVGVSITIRV